MSTVDVTNDTAVRVPDTGTVDVKLEVVALRVSDVDRAKQFYTSLGWREAADFPAARYMQEARHALPR
jgi:catechol-2,3-dioxygenase